MELFPHVARFRDRIEPEGACDDERARVLLQSLRALLRMVGPATRHPGLVREHAIDSIGKYLDPTHSEPVRMRLMGQDGAARPPRVTLKKRSHEILSVAASERLEDRARMLCTPIRGSDEVARRLGSDDRALAELVVEFEGGGKLTLRQHVDPLRAVVIATMAGTGQRKALDAKLQPDQKFCLAKCFAGAGTGRLGAVRQEPVAAHHVKTSGRGFHELPVWMTEHLATIAQDIFRLHVLTSSSSQDVSRMVLVNRAFVFRFEPTADDPRLLIKAALHSASGGCLCGLHNRRGGTATAAFKSIDFRIRICDEPFVPHGDAPTPVCPRHYEADDPSTHEQLEATSVAPGRCCRGLSFEVWCVHDRTAGDPNAGLRIPLPVPETWMLSPLREVAMACCALTRPEMSGANNNNDKVLDLKATVDGVMQYIERERMARGHVESMLQPADRTAVWLFRNDTPSCGSDGKLRGKRVQKEFHDIVPTHGHLFKRMRV